MEKNFASEKKLLADGREVSSNLCIDEAILGLGHTMIFGARAGDMAPCRHAERVLQIHTGAETTPVKGRIKTGGQFQTAPDLEPGARNSGGHTSTNLGQK